MRFSFAVVSDTHNDYRCKVAQGRWVTSALRTLAKLRPDFVVGLGDLISGGGDCGGMGHGLWDQAPAQLLELERVLLKRLPVPFVPVSGNHDLSPAHTGDRTRPRRVWSEFWESRAHFLLPSIRPFDMSRSFRFTYRGVSFAAVSAYGTTGLHALELEWLRRNLKPGDVVLRHTNPWGISCLVPGVCGSAIGHQWHPTPGLLPRLLKKRRIKALFSGHTHAFYEGVCDSIRFVNTGALGERSMEYVRGWDDSPYRKRKAFTWVDVLHSGELVVTFYIWEPSRQRFQRFDPSHFPATVHTHPVFRLGQFEGLTATCVTRRGPTT
ncbi:MAG: metallophosphoesterase [bacterium]